MIDEFTANPRPGDIMMEDKPPESTRANLSARQQGSGPRRRPAAEDNAGTISSGGNITNATRQQIKTLQNSRGDWTPDEQDALTSVIRGTTTNNLLRQPGKFSPEGNGLTARQDAFGTLTGFPCRRPTGGLTTAVVPVVGFVAKRIADAAITRGAASVGDLFRAGGDRSALTRAPNTFQQFVASAASPDLPQALARSMRQSLLSDHPRLSSK